MRKPRWWIAPPLEQWFRGERSIPIITAMAVPFRGQLDALWQAWIEIHPDAVRRADWPRPASERERQVGLR
jgi:hypothetical protein